MLDSGSSNGESQKLGFFARFNPFQKRPSNRDKESEEARALLLAWVRNAQCDSLNRACKLGASLCQPISPVHGCPLHVAARQGSLEALIIIVSRGVQDVSRNSRGQFALHVACENGHEDCAHYIIKNASSQIDVKDSDGMSPVMLAVMNDHLPAVKLLVGRGASMTGSVNNAGRPAIHLCKSEEMLDYLLENTSLAIDAPGTNGETLLHIAAAGNNVAMARACLYCHASLTYANNDGLTPLHSASLNQSGSIVKLLLDAGAPVTVPDKAGFTPIELALLHKDLQTVDVFYNASTVFTGRQLLLLSILRREDALHTALKSEEDAQEQVAEGSYAVDDVGVIPKATPWSEALRLAASHPNLAFVEPSLPGSHARSRLYFKEEVQADLARLENLADPVRRPTGSNPSSMLLTVFTQSLRHSMPARPGVPHLTPPSGLSMITRSHSGDLHANDTSGTQIRTPTTQIKIQADEKEPAVVGSRTSLERMLPHYMVGIITPASETSRPSTEMKQALASMAGSDVDSKPDKNVLPEDDYPPFTAPAWCSNSRDSRARPPSFQRPHRSSSEGPSTRCSTQIANSLFFQQTRFSRDGSNTAPASLSFGSDMNQQQRGRKSVVHRRRNPWGAIQESDPNEERFPSRSMRSMPASRGEGFKASERKPLNLDALHEEKMDGMADFEDMMARRAALFQGPVYGS